MATQPPFVQKKPARTKAAAATSAMPAAGLVPRFDSPGDPTILRPVVVTSGYEELLPKRKTSGRVSESLMKRSVALRRKLKVGESLDSTVDEFIPFAVWVWNTSPLERILAIKEGISPLTVARVADGLAMSKVHLAKMLGLSRATLQRQESAQQPLSTDSSSKVMGVVRLIGQVQDMVGKDAPKDFDAGHWLSKWLHTESAALGGLRPADIMDTADGQQLVSDILAQAQSGAYA